MSKEKQNLVSNLIWRFAERTGAQSVAFIVSIILARILSPDVYGKIVLVMVFTSIMQVFIDSGLGNALIQKKDADDIDFSTVFFFNIGVCITLYMLVFILSPAIAQFYNQPDLIMIIRVLSVTIIVSGVKNVQQAYISKKMLFKYFFFATLAGTIGAAIIGIVMALMGFGVWALVAQQVVNVTVDTLVLWLTIGWRPKMVFSFKRLKQLFAFGSKLLISNLIDTIYNDLRQITIGKYYSSADLAYFNKGKQFPYMIIVNINKSIDSVLFPVLSQHQNSKSQLKNMTQKSIRLSSYVIWPLMIGLAVIAEPLVYLVLTEKWAPCIPILRIFCLTYGFFPIHTANLNAIKSLGQSDTYLKLEIVKKLLGISVLLVTMRKGIVVMAYGLLFSTVISTFINASPNRKYLDYGYIEQIKDMLPSFGLAVMMGGLIWPIQYIAIRWEISIFLQIFAGIIIYVIGSKFMCNECYQFLLKMIKAFLLKTQILHKSN